MNKVVLALLFFLVAESGFSMAKSVKGEIILRLDRNREELAVLGTGQDFRIKEVLNEALNLYLVEVRNQSNEQALKVLNQQEAVLYAQENHLLSLRSQSDLGSVRMTKPDDPEFSKLWNLFDFMPNYSGISAMSVWNMSTGGKDVSGNEIVVAVIDNGFDLNHVDLKENVWKNLGEIPNNNIDDDGNGFVDDVNGWNAFTDSGAITSADHGTHVAGIIGASGNNGLGVVGVNWKVKIMAIQGATGTTATLVKAYGYAIEQKKLWLNSQGRSGANVVSTNSSFGVDRAHCKTGDYPVWNDLYDQMGHLGILSATATANNNWNVDELGDVPTTCESDFIIAVTNTQQDGSKYPRAGYGATSIDLGAPGSGILSTVPRDKYSVMSGTSMATPHVAGAIGLIHAVAGKEYNDFYLTDPGAAARAMKQALLQGVDPISSLNGVTVSGGLMNVSKAAQLLNQKLSAKQ